MPIGTRVVVFGGTGHFGAKIRRRPAADPDIDLVVTSRSANRAAKFAADLNKEARNIESAAIDPDPDDMPRRLRKLPESGADIDACRPHVRVWFALGLPAFSAGLALSVVMVYGPSWSGRLPGTV